MIRPSGEEFKKTLKTAAQKGWELPLEIWVETLKPLHDDHFTPEARLERKWGVRGRIIAHHNSHGLCYDVLHDDGTEACYDPDELALCVNERDLTESEWEEIDKEFKKRRKKLEKW